MCTKLVSPIVSLLIVLGMVSAFGVVPEVAEGRCKSALSTARSVVPVATVCVDAGEVLLPPASASGGGPICYSDAIVEDEWPMLPYGYRWDATGIRNPSWYYSVAVQDCGELFTTCMVTGL